MLQDSQYIVKLIPPGQLIIAIAATATATLRPGRYLDWLRATDAAGTDTFWSGTIAVAPTRGENDLRAVGWRRHREGTCAWRL